MTDPTAVAAPGGRTTTMPNGVTHVAPGTTGIVAELLTTAPGAELLAVGERTPLAVVAVWNCPGPGQDSGRAYVLRSGFGGRT